MLVLFFLELISTVAVAFVPSHASTDRTVAGRADQECIMMGDTESLDDSNDYEYMEGSTMNSPVMPHSKRPPHPKDPAQPLAVPRMHWQSRKNGGIASLGNSQVMPAKKGNNHHSPCSDLRKLQSNADS